MHNRSPSSSISSGATPYELWHKSKPDVAHFRVFGCTAYVHVKKDKRKQLQSHSQKCVFIGYPSNYKAWVFWNPVSKKEIVSNSAEFDERYFHGNSSKPIDWKVPELSPEAPQEPVEAVGDSWHDLPQPPAAELPSDDDADPKSEPDTDMLNSQNAAPSSPAPSSRSSTPPAPPNRPDTPPAPPSPPSTPPAAPAPSTPAQSPEDVPQNPLKRQLSSPGAGALSPEHKVHVINPAPTRPAAPQFTAQPMSDFRPISSGPYGRFQHFKSFSEFLPRRTQSQSSSAAPHSFNFDPARDAPHLQAQQEPESDVEMEDQRDSSPDPLDFLSNDALMVQSLQDMAGNASYLSLEDAFEYALQSKLQHSVPSEPVHWKDIAGRPDAELWHAATMEEFSALLENGTFEPVKLPADRRAIGCRWVFKLKRKPDGSIDRYKARLVGKGFS